MARWYAVYVQGEGKNGQERVDSFICNGDTGRPDAEQSALRAFRGTGGLRGAVTEVRPCTEGGNSL